MSRERAFTLSVVTPEGAVLETAATSVVFPAYDGEYGILPNHAPLVALLGIGELRVEREDGGHDRFFVDNGFAQFADNKLSVLTEQARRVADLDPAAAQKLLEEARAMPGGDAEAIEARQAALERGRVQKRLVARRG